MPKPSQLRHWYVNVGAPCHTPLPAVSVWPCCAAPEIVGGTEFTGCAGMKVA